MYALSLVPRPSFPRGPGYEASMLWEKKNNRISTPCTDETWNPIHHGCWWMINGLIKLHLYDTHNIILCYTSGTITTHIIVMTSRLELTQVAKSFDCSFWTCICCCLFGCVGAECFSSEYKGLCFTIEVSVCPCTEPLSGGLEAELPSCCECK